MYFQQGGQQAQIMQIIQQYAQMNQIDPKQLMQKLQQMPAEQQQQAIQQMMQTLQQGGGAQQQQPDMEQAAMAYGGYTTGIFAGGGMIHRADGSYSKRGLWDNIRANKGSGKKPTKEMLEQESKIRAQEAAYGGVYGNGGTNNAGFDALPDYVQAKILSNMGYGGYYNPMSEMAGANYQQGGQPDYTSILEQNAADAEKYPSAYHKDYVTGYPVSNTAGSIPRPGGFDCPPGYTKYSNGDGTFSCIMTNPHPGSGKTDLSRMTKVADDMQFSKAMQKSLAAAPIKKKGGSTFSGNAFYQGGGQSVIVNDPNDPRLTAYNDSLYKYNSTNRFNNFLDRYQTGVDDVDKSLNKYNTLKRANKELSTNKAINKFPYFVPHGGGSPIINGEYNVFKKPTQQVMYLPASNMAYGGPVEGDVLDVTPEELQMLKQGGYNFEIID